MKEYFGTIKEHLLDIWIAQQMLKLVLPRLRSWDMQANAIKAVHVIRIYFPIFFDGID